MRWRSDVIWIECCVWQTSRGRLLKVYPEVSGCDVEATCGNRLGTLAMKAVLQKIISICPINEQRHVQS